MRWASTSLMVAALLAAFAIWCLTQQGTAHVSLASPVSASDFAVNLHATGGRAVAALGAAALSLLLFIFGFIRAFRHFGQPVAGTAARQQASPAAPAVAEAKADTTPQDSAGGEPGG